MSTLDFSRFDRALAPVIVLSPELKIIYANEEAVRAYCFLEGDGLRLFYTSSTLRKISQRLSEGQAFSLPVESDVKSSFLFEPVLDWEGNVIYAFLCPAGLEDGPRGSLRTSGRELFAAVRSELAEPICDVLHLLEAVETQLPADLSLPMQCSLRGIRYRLLRISKFLLRTEDPVTPGGGSVVSCNANEVLRLCGESFPRMRYTPCEACYVPLGRDELIHLAVDILSVLFFRQEPGSNIGVSLEHDEHESRIIFLSGKVDATVLCNTKMHRESLGLSELRYRVEAVGGTVSVDPQSRGKISITLTFPRIQFMPGSVTLGDFSAEAGLAASSRYALEYLRALCDAG